MHKSTWDDLRFVLAVAEAGSVNAATQALGVNHATVLRRVAAFEARHGLTVFQRNTTGYRVDPACLPLIEAIAQVGRAVEGVDRVLARRDLQVSGALRLTTTDSLAESVLPALLSRLRDAHPGMVVEVEVTNRRLDLARLDADLAIRPARSLPADLEGTHAGRMVFGVYGAPQMLSRAATEEVIPWIGVAGPLRNSPIAEWETARSGIRIVATASSFPAMAAFASAGMGLAMIPCCLGDTTPGLLRSKAVPDELETGLWVANHPDLGEVPRVARTREALVEGLRAMAPLIEGRTHMGA